MAVGRKYIGFNADVSGAESMTAFMQEISLSMKTPAHIGSVLRYSHAVLSGRFDMFMSGLAPTAPSRYHHVYEWNQIGIPKAQLWKNVLIGGGNNRIATFEWRASKTIVPVREPLPAPKMDVGRKVERKTSDRRPKAIHVFVWKAPIMEYGTEVTVAPKRGKFIVYYTGPTSDPGGPLYQDLKFSSKPITVRNPGGKAATGAFTSAYIAWWSKGQGQTILNDEIKKTISSETANEFRDKMLILGQRSRQKQINMKVMGNNRQAIALGRRQAKAAMSALQANYIEQAKAREMFMGGMEEE